MRQIVLYLLCLIPLHCSCAETTDVPVTESADTSAELPPEDQHTDNNIDEEDSSIEAFPETAEEADSPLFGYLDEHQRTVSSYLHRFVTGVDNFFTDSQSVDESTRSYLRLTTEMIWPEGKGMEFDGGISLKIRLPKTQRKVKLTFESDVDEKRGALEQETSEASTTSDGEDRTYYTGLESELKPIRKWKIRPSIGARIRSPIDWYVRLRANREVYFDKWALHFNETLFWFDSTGTGSDTTMRWDRQISDDILFRSNSFARYTRREDMFEMSQTFSLIHTLSEKRAITYKIGAFGVSEPTVHATDYLINVQYRNNLHADYLFLDIQPQVLFERENEFKGQFELLIRLELFYRG